MAYKPMPQAKQRSVQNEIILRIKSLDAEETYYWKKREDLLRETALEADKLKRLAEHRSSMRQLYEVLLKDSLGIEIEVPDTPPEASSTAVEIPVRRGSSVAISPLG